MISRQLQENSKYIIFTSYIHNDKEIYELEMNSLLGFIPENNYFFSSELIDINRSVFYRSILTIMYKEKNVKEIVNKIINDSLFIDGYKIEYIKSNEQVSYEERIDGLKQIGSVIEGTFMITNPTNKLALTKVDNHFVFGYITYNEHDWKKRVNKPYNYSFSLEVKLAKSLLNIIVGNELNKSIIDPCCGVGTVLVEGKFMGMNIRGNDIIKLVHHQCNYNLKHYGFETSTTNKDIHDINEHYDIAILDVPYGHFTDYPEAKRVKLIKKTKELSDKAIIVSNENIESTLNDINYSIIKKASIKKTNSFTRYVYVMKS